MEAESTPLQGLTADISTGIKTNLKDAYVFELPSGEIPVDDELLRPVLDGADIHRYSSIDIQKFIAYPYVSASDETIRPIELDDCPITKEHFSAYEKRLRERLFYEKTVEEMGKEWFEFPYTSENLLAPKVLFPDISTEPRATFDSTGDVLVLNTAYGAVFSDSVEIDVRFVCALFNSSVLRFTFTTLSPKLSGGYYRFQTQYVGQLPIVDIIGADNGSADELKQAYRNRVADEPDRLVESPLSDYPELGDRNQQTHDLLVFLADEIVGFGERRSGINLNLPDYLGSYKDGPTLGDLYQPPAGLTDSILTATTEDRENLKIESATITDDGSKLVLRATARYKPENPDEYETDQYGYTETDSLPAMEFVGLTEREHALVEAFVPYAVEEVSGFANFRENATKTNSLIDRLEALTLPALDDVADGLERYRETKARAEELDEKIGKTDELIDQIVYELYGLTDEEIEIVEEAVGD